MLAVLLVLSTNLARPDQVDRVDRGQLKAPNEKSTGEVLRKPGSKESNSEFTGLGGAAPVSK